MSDASVIGLGAMGSALAEALLDEGYPTTHEPTLPGGQLQEEPGVGRARRRDRRRVRPERATQVVLAWALGRGEEVVPIPGTTSPQHVEENAAAAEIELAEEDVHRLEEVFPPGAAAGERYAESDMELVSR